MTEAKPTIILSQQSDWLVWYAHIRSIAVSYRLWEYVNPEETMTLPMPNEPIRPIFAETFTQGEAMVDLNNHQLALWQELRREYEIDYKRFETIDNRARALFHTIMGSLSINNRRLVSNAITSRDTLSTLYNIYAPTNESRKRHVIRQWHALQQGPSRDRSIEKWLTNWENIYTEASQMEIAEATESRALYDFLEAVGSLSPHFTEYWTNHLTTIRESGGKMPDFYWLLKKYRDSIRLNPPKIATKVAHATFQGHDQSGKSQQKDQTNSTRDLQCPCQEDPKQGNHVFDNCRYINPKIRPNGWTASPDAEERFKKACQHEGFNHVYKNALKRHNSDQKTEPDQKKLTMMTTRFSGQTTQTQTTRDSRNLWVFDTGSDTHLCNDITKFVNYTQNSSHVSVGDTTTKIEGFGTVLVQPTESPDQTVFELTNVAYSPGFHLNLISAGLAEKAGAWYNGRKGHLESNKGSLICKVKKMSNLIFVQWQQDALDQLKSNDQTNTETDYSSDLVDHMTSLNISNTTRSSDPHLTKGSYDLWHARLGHPNEQVLKHLEKAATNVEIDQNSTLSSCETCLISKAERQISRRPMTIGDQPFEAVHWDLIHMTKAYNHCKYVSHLIDPVTKYQISSNLSRKDQVTDAIRTKFAFINNQFDIRPKVVHCDGDRNLLPFLAECEEKGIEVHVTPPHQPEQNGYAERYGALISTMARTMLINANLPAFLWPEAVNTAVYTQNKLPNKQLNWISPQQALVSRLAIAPAYMTLIPSLSNIRVYGCKAYVRILSIPRLFKMSVRAQIGYLVGYDASNIWRIWIPQSRKIIRARDVVFDETSFYTPEEERENDIPVVNETNEVISTLIQSEFDQLIDEIEVAEEVDISDETVDETRDDEMEDQLMPEAPDQPEAEITSDEILGDQPETPDESETDEILGDQPPTPSESTQSDDKPRDDGLMVLIDNSNINDSSLKRPFSPDNDEGSPDKKHRTNLILSYLRAFSTALLSQPKKTPVDNLPKEPDNWSEVQFHAYKAEWRCAMQVEYDKLNEMNAWIPEKADHVTQLHSDQCGDILQNACPRHQILPIRWVFKYKSDENGFLTRFKARICVRGDLQIIEDKEDVRATTLAARTLRTLLAIAAAFDLETFQMDAVNAFLNSSLSPHLYCQFPPGYRRRGYVLRLNQALYGLRISPRLWEETIKLKLIEIGFRPIPEDPCLFSDGKVILMIFVDDLLGIHLPKHRKHAEFVRNRLHQSFEMKDCGELSQFIGIHVIRDRTKQKIWLNQDAYIEKISHRFHLTNRKPPKTPLPSENLAHISPDTSPDHKAHPQLINHYQSLVGSIGFAAIMTRPDIAFAHQMLSQWLTKPERSHVIAAEQTISYLYGTRYHSIEFDGSCDPKYVFRAASDASFADNIGRKSSQGFIFTLFGGPIDWSARKQRIVTTSTTEAELVALSEAAKHLLWTKRLLRSIEFDPENDLILSCDNKQTIDLMIKPNSSYQTKLRHVDINQHWLREKVRNGDIYLQWIQTNNMIADGLTKHLPSQKHVEFLNQLNLRQLPNRVTEFDNV